MKNCVRFEILILAIIVGFDSSNLMLNSVLGEPPEKKQNEDVDPARTRNFHGDSKILFATPAEGTAVLSRQDAFLASLSRFDIQSRMNTDRAVNKSEYVEFIGKEVLPWKPEEQQRLQTAVERVSQKLSVFELPFPKQILLVKTTGREEGGAAYCRGNAIVLPSRQLQRSEEAMQRLLIHELFHVLSSTNPALRDRLYSIIGFSRCPTISLPKSLQDRKITNPDAPTIEHFIEVDYQGKEISVAPILIADKADYVPSRNGSFFKYMQFRLLQLTREGERMVPSLVDQKPLLLDPNKVPSYRAQIGDNTNYIIHPDEILADNFVLMVVRHKEPATPMIIEKLQAVLKTAKRESRP